jgi:hypothetical protein
MMSALICQHLKNTLSLLLEESVLSRLCWGSVAAALVSAEEDVGEVPIEVVK